MRFVKIDSPKSFFDKEKNILGQTVAVVRDAFASPMEFEDVYAHLTSPEKVYLVFEGKDVIGMGSYSERIFSGIPTLIVDGIAIRESFQGKGIFGGLTDLVLKGEKLICLRTQSPQMYRALEKKCRFVYPGKDVRIPEAIMAVLSEYGEFLNCVADESGVVRGFYGKSLYGKENAHHIVSPIFEKLDMNISAGDAMLVAGVR